MPKKQFSKPVPSSPTTNNHDFASSDEELVPLSSGTKESDVPQVVSKRSFTRYIVIGAIVMVGCYHLGRWTCLLEHQDALEEGSVQKKKGGKFKFQKEEADLERQYALTPPKIQAVRQQGIELIDLLNEYYKHHKGGASHILLGDGGWSKGWNDAMQGAPREEKLVETLARALLDPHQRTFKIGVIGSSVAAGHDNCVYDNYENQLTRTWSNVWKAAGMNLEIQNAGQGGGCGDSHKNQVWCIQQNVSPDVDIVHYSWSYFEVGADADGRKERESLVRWSHLLPRAPPVHVVNVACSDTCLWNHPDEPRLIEAYEPYGYNAFCNRYALINALHRKMEDPNQDPMFQGQHSGDGFHNTTRYAFTSNETITPERAKSLGVILRNWHPGPLGFQIISDAMAYTYTKALLTALDRIEQTMDPKKLAPTNAEAPEAVWWKDRPVLLGSDLIDPLVCDAQYCTVDQPPKCLNLELPTFGYWGASITPQDDDLNPFKGELQAWKMWKEGGDVRWDMVNRLEQQYYKDQPEKCVFPDHCAGIRANSLEEGRVVFKLPKMEVGMIAICFCCGKEVAQKQLMDNPHVEIQFNQRILDHSTFDLYPENKCVRVVKDHSGTVVGKTGHAYLSVRLLEGNTEQVTISHVITL